MFLHDVVDFHCCQPFSKTFRVPFVFLLIINTSIKMLYEWYLMQSSWETCNNTCMLLVIHVRILLKTFTVFNQCFLYTVFIDTRIRTEQSVNEVDFCCRANGEKCVCVCVCFNCSQFLNINLKVKGREFFDIRAGCRTLCPVLELYSHCCCSHWLTESLYLLLFLPFFL